MDRDYRSRFAKRKKSDLRLATREREGERAISALITFIAVGLVVFLAKRKLTVSVLFADL